MDGPGPTARIAVIGTGMAGATAARLLAEAGHDVALFDKGRGAGGRMSTRRVGSGDPESGRPAFGPYDHGAQYFTARDAGFRRLVESWVADGTAAPWGGVVARCSDHGLTRTNDEDRFVGVPGMNAVIRSLLAELPVEFGTRVTALIKRADGWRIQAEDDRDRGPFDAVVVAVPAVQAVDLLAASQGLSESAAAAEMAPCWTLMATFPNACLPALPDGTPISGAIIEDGGPLAWIGANSSKPGRRHMRAGPADSADYCDWVIQSTPQWSTQNLEQNPEAVRAALLAAAAPMLGLPITTQPAFAAVHRWRYAKVQSPVGVDCLFDEALGIGACGDWCRGPRVEAAYLSGAALAGTINEWLSAASRTG